jgi:outer membrane protein assembly factor BamB
MLVLVLSCRRNQAPGIPTAPVGPSACFTDTTYTFTTIASDPDGDSVAVRFDWGDSIFSEWSVPVASGDTVALAHAWTDTGTYEVRAQARDAALLTSGWSTAFAVRVVVTRDAPQEPSGPDRGWQDSSYTFGIFVPFSETIAVAIRFSWGDGDTTDWSSFVSPGDSVKRSHIWSVPDTYAVTAQAKDTANTLSQWSIPHNVRIKPPDTLQLWRFKLTAQEGGSFFSSPAFGPDGNIYVGSIDFGLYSISPNGTLRWSFPTGNIIRSSPAIAPDGTIYVGSYDNVLYAINPDGSLRWSFPTDGAIHASPAIGAAGTIYFSSLDHWFYAVDPNGGPDWHVLANRAGRSSSAVGADGVVYVGTDDADICAVNPNGSTKWAYKTGGTIHSAPSIGADGTVYCGSDDGYLYALNSGGSLKWRFATDSTVQGSAVIASDGTIYFGSDNGNLYALNPDGSLKWKYLTGGSVGASPAIASDGTIYFGSADNSVYALNPDGSAKWQFESVGAVQSSPTIGPDGKVYFTSKDGYLYALKGTSPLAGSPWPKFHHDLRNTGRVGGSR